MEGIAGKTALVTGAGSADGIGFAIARRLAESGASVALTSTTDRIELRRAALPGENHRAIVADLIDEDQVRNLAETVLAHYGRIDILVNNAGMVQTGKDSGSGLPFHETGFDRWQRDMDLNLTTCFHVTRAVLPAMLRAGYGRIVNIASVTGPLVTAPGTAGYSAAKAAMVGLTRALAHEVGRQGIMVNAVAPGWIATASSPEKELVAGAHTPVGRSGRPAEVAEVALFLASEGCSYLTGQMLVVDGGNSLQEYKGPIDPYI